MAAYPSSIPHLIIPERVSSGYGDYLFYRLNADQTPSTISHAEFTRLFEEKILPLGHETPTASMQKKYEIAKEKVQLVDPTIHLTFIPRVLLELALLHRMIDEDYKSESICPLADLKFHEKTLEKQEILESKTCWHTLCFRNDSDDLSAEVVKLAHQLNASLVDELKPDGNPFSFDQLSDLLKIELEFFSQLPAKKDKVIEFKRTHVEPSPTWNFSIPAGQNKAITIKSIQPTPITIRTTSMSIAAESYKQMIYRTF
ncbi:MAG: hypothetical protein K2P51_04600 [Rhabdochlamydiaceae bacterium]|nr:hypothetical protein [Rhabdochlamydiaceae bacterium]